MCAAIVLSACHTGTFDRLAGQDEAEAIVWNQTYGMDGPAPPVEWFTGDQLDCPLGFGTFGFSPGLSGPDDLVRSGCVGGRWWNVYNRAQVAYVDRYGIKLSSYAHELYHAYLYQTTGDSDSDHCDPGFNGGGLVERANKALHEAGL